MGQLSIFQCDTCGYKIQVSGKRDSGMTYIVDTFTCFNCKRVEDIIVGETKDFELYHNNKIVCSKCNSNKDLEKWEGSEQKCPVCDGVFKVLFKNYVMWD